MSTSNAFWILAKSKIKSSLLDVLEPVLVDAEDDILIVKGGSDKEEEKAKP